MIHRWSIARRLFVAHLLFMVALTAIVGTATFVDARDHAYDEAGRRMAGIATTVADAPFVLQAAGAADPSALLQPYALKVMNDAGADFVTIMAPDRTRWTHPRNEELGKPYIGSIDAALNGQVFTEVTAGTLGPSVRTIAPVKDADGKVRALVAAGVTVRTVDVAVSGRLPALLAIALALLVGGSLASWLLGRYLRRVTRGWGPEQLGQLFAYYESVLHSVREGVILIDPQGQSGDVQRPGRRPAGAGKQSADGAAGTDARSRAAAGARRRHPSPTAAGTQPEGTLRIRADRARRDPSDRLPDPGGQPGPGGGPGIRRRARQRRPGTVLRHGGHHPGPHRNRIPGQRTRNHAHALGRPPRPDPRARQPAPHHRLADGAGPGARGAGLRHEGPGTQPAADR